MQFLNALWELAACCEIVFKWTQQNFTNEKPSLAQVMTMFVLFSHPIFTSTWFAKLITISMNEIFVFIWWIQIPFNDLVTHAVCGRNPGPYFMKHQTPRCVEFAIKQNAVITLEFYQLNKARYVEFKFYPFQYILVFPPWQSFLCVRIVWHHLYPRQWQGLFWCMNVYLNEIGATQRQSF